VGLPLGAALVLVGATPGRAAAAPAATPPASLVVRAAPAATPPEALFHRFYLAPRGGLRALKRAVLAVSTPGSRRYGHFLTPRRFRARFGPTAREVRAVRAAVRAAGGRVTAVERHRRWVLTTGLAAAEAADLARTRGVLAEAPFDASGRVIRRGRTIGPPNIGSVSMFRPGRPCAAYYGQFKAAKRADGTELPLFRGRRPPFAVCGYTPRQLHSAYVEGSRLTGRGITVAVVDPFASPTILEDANRVARRSGFPPFRRGQLTQSLPSRYDVTGEPVCDVPEGWTVEETLDVEAVHAIAPGANVRYYAAPRCDDPADPGTLDALARVVDENRSSFVSNSYGNPEAQFGEGTRVGYEQIALQAAMQGIGVLWSSGDFGAVLSYPASDPWVTAVGGTSDAIGRSGRFLFQTGWESEAYSLSADGRSWLDAGPGGGGSGGGFSQVYPRPAYQRGVVPARAPRGRAYPDVAMLGNGTTGMRVGQTVLDHGRRRFVEMRLGGTSLSAPLTAGIQALAAQAAGRRLGWANPALYAQARHHAGTFSDITNAHAADANVRVLFGGRGAAAYTLRTLGKSQGFGRPLRAARGWDPVTGLGVPNRRYLRRQGR
jgi:subtilase family serine protease